MDLSNKIVVCYGDSVIRETDISLLRGPEWLNDSIISFYFEYLSTNTFKDNVKDALFIGPEVTHCLKAAAVSDLPLFLDPLHAKEKKIVFFALNDNRLYGQSGGTHWTLLVFSQQEKVMYHFDSLSGSNFRQAGQLAGKLFQYFTATGKGEFEEVDCLQQSNGYDCGIFVICHAEHIMTQFLKNGYGIAECGRLSKETVLRKRSDILKLIIKLQK